MVYLTLMLYKSNISHSCMPQTSQESIDVAYANINFKAILFVCLFVIPVVRP